MFLVDDNTLLALLKEDIPYGDLTTRALGIDDKPAIISMKARNDMVICGVEEASRLLALCGLKTDIFCKSGSHLKAGQTILGASGPANSVFGAWKVSQTLMEWASGISSATARLVQTAKQANAQIVVACTRKPVPGTRNLSLKAIVSGGASIHRSGLSDTILLFPEHQTFAGATGIEGQIRQLKANCPERRIVVEVNTIEQAITMARHGVDVIQLEKFEPAQIRETRLALGPDWAGSLAAAGGINEKNAHEYANSGAHILVTSSPYYAKPADVAVTISPD